MSWDKITGTDWSEGEIDLVVADYFDMRRLELLDQPFVKLHRNKQLQQLTGRSAGSIEFKHQNISAVLMRLGERWVKGYKPMANFQKALLDGVERYLNTGTYRAGIFEAIPTAGLSEGAMLFFDQPPPLAPPAPVREPAELRRLIRKFDPAARDEKNRVLGRHGEEIIFETERNRLILEDRPDLARRVRWVSAEDGDGAGYDIHSFDRRGRDRLLEVKTTAGHELTPFYLSENERAVSDERADDFRLIRVYDAMRAPRAFELHPPLENWVHLQAISYRANFGVQT